MFFLRLTRPNSDQRTGGWDGEGASGLCKTRWKSREDVTERGEGESVWLAGAQNNHFSGGGGVGEQISQDPQLGFAVQQHQQHQQHRNGTVSPTTT